MSHRSLFFSVRAIECYLDTVVSKNVFSIIIYETIYKRYRHHFWTPFGSFLSVSLPSSTKCLSVGSLIMYWRCDLFMWNGSQYSISFGAGFNFDVMNYERFVVDCIYKSSAAKKWKKIRRENPLGRRWFVYDILFSSLGFSLIPFDIGKVDKSSQCRYHCSVGIVIVCKCHSCPCFTIPFLFDLIFRWRGVRTWQQR